MGGKKGIVLAVGGVALVSYATVQSGKKAIQGYKKKQADLVKDYAFEMIR
jgi:hypothetical protein